MERKTCSYLDWELNVGSGAMVSKHILGQLHRHLRCLMPLRAQYSCFPNSAMPLLLDQVLKHPHEAIRRGRARIPPIVVSHQRLIILSMFNTWPQGWSLFTFNLLVHHRGTCH